MLSHLIYCIKEPMARHLPKQRKDTWMHDVIIGSYNWKLREMNKLVFPKAFTILGYVCECRSETFEHSSSAERK